MYGPDARTVRDAARLRWFRGIFGLCLLSTLLLSYRAWLASGREYPLLPVVDGMPQPPFPLDAGIFVILCLAVLGGTGARSPRRFLAAALTLLALLFLLDQTRWQPYMLTYVAGVVCLLLGEGRAAERGPAAAWHMAPFQLSLCCTWLWSGLQKLNARFLEWDFPRMASPVTRRLGISDVDAVPLLVWPGLASAVFEAAMGAALLWPRTRRAGVIGLTLMHVYIMLVLGPLGRVANPVVWPWNAVVVAALWLLFWPRDAGASLDAFRRAWWARLRGAGGAGVPRRVGAAWVAVILFFGVLPGLSLVERWDASLSFQLYAGRQRQVWICHRPDVRAGLGAAALGASRAPGKISLARWSLDELRVVPVTEPRQVIRLGREVARRAPDAGVYVVIAGPPHWRTGARVMHAIAFRGPAQTPVEVEAPPLGAECAVR